MTPHTTSNEARKLIMDDLQSPHEAVAEAALAQIRGEG